MSELDPDAHYILRCSMHLENVNIRLLQQTLKAAGLKGVIVDADFDLCDLAKQPQDIKDLIREALA